MVPTRQSFGSAVPANHQIAFELGLGAATGLLSHWCFFIRGEHHQQAPLYLRLYGLLALATYAIEIKITGCTYTQAWLHGTMLLCAYAGTLFLSILIYRYWFHRTKSFPGPRLAGVTKFWHVWQVRNSQNHLVLEELRKKYGDFVRTVKGPNEITVFLPEALNATNGPGSECTKAPWYDFLKPQIAINTNRDPTEHEARRKLWKPSFLKDTLGKYEDVLFKYLDQLDSRIELSKGCSLDIVTLIYWWSFDVMGELTVSFEFNMLRSGEWHKAITILRRFMALLGPCTPVPWLGRIGFSLPGVTKDWNRMIAFCKRQTERRITIQEKQFDISQPLVEHFRRSVNVEADRHYLEGDTIAMIIAGSDTNASTAVYALRHLAMEPAYQLAIINEMKEAGINDLRDSQAMQNLPFLDAVIKETMRLHPPVVTGGPRNTGPNGLWIRGQHIPPNTTIIAPRYNISRLATAFTHPETFIPSRWLGEKSIDIHDTRAYAPFSAGRYACIGRALATRQMKLVVAYIVSRYEICLAPGESGLEVETEMRDQFTAVPGRLFLSFNRREQTVDTSQAPGSKDDLLKTDSGIK